MDALKDFRAKDMIEQITLLDQIRETGDTAAVPALFDLYAHPVGDQAVDEMVYHALFDLLGGQYDRIQEGMNHGSPEVQLLCVRRATEEKADSLKAPLVALLGATESVELAGEIIRALAQYKDATLVDTLLPFLRHDDYTVVAWALRALTNIHSPAVRDILVRLIDNSDEVKGTAMGCDLRTALLVEGVAGFTDAATVDYLIGHIHHGNPSFRRVVLSALGSMGEVVLPALEKTLESGDKDEKIMAANILGLTGHKKAADILVAHLEGATDPNLRFAMYEALGRINSLRSVIGLADGLAEQDELVLIAVVTALDHLANPGVVKVVTEALDKGGSQAEHIVRAIATTRARNLFAALYGDGRHNAMLLAAIQSSGDPEVKRLFKAMLEKIGSAGAKADAAKLEGAAASVPASGKRLLAADDSKAMLFFYKGVAADLGMELVTAEDGKQAHDHLQIDSDFVLVITDMNMPNMDGIELTRAIRANPALAKLPVLMATTESEKSQSDLARAAGVTDFITKPFGKEDFKAKVAALLK
ncbi:MAG: HEAT repeat domain-containing protein [Thermodesulfobacteriota bacterium]